MRRLTALIWLAATISAAAQEPGARRPLDHGVYDHWKRVMEERLSNDGRWLLYALAPEEGDAVLEVKETSASGRHVVPRGSGGRFSEDGRWAVFMIKPELQATRAAKRAKKKPEEQPKDSLGILDLATGLLVKIERVQSFKLPEEGSGWLAYLLEKEATKDTARTEDTTGAAPQDSAQKRPKKKKEEGATLILRRLETGAEQRYEHVVEYAFATNARRFAFATSTRDGSGDGIHLVDLETGVSMPLMTGQGVYKHLTFDASGEQLAWITDRDDYAARQPAFSLVHWRAGGQLGARVRPGSPGLREGWWVSEDADLAFSKDGRRLFFGTAPRPVPDPEDEPAEWEEVKLDVWNWRDPLLQPMQLVQRERELKRSYRAVLHLRDNRVVQLADDSVPEVTVAREGESDVALGVSDVPYRQLVSWDFPRYHDAYLIDVRSGTRRRVLEKIQAEPDLSPDGRYLTWWDGHRRAWFALSTQGGSPVNLTAQVPYPVHDELNDAPMIPPPYGMAGWTAEDRSFLVYDAHDIWATDPTGRRPPRRVTEGVGRRTNREFRYLRLDPEARFIPEREPILLRVFDRGTKGSGFARDRLEGEAEPQVLVLEDRTFRLLQKAKRADVLLFTRERFDEFPDLWVSDLTGRTPRRMSEANPAMREFRWGTAELVRWRSLNGQPLEGLLFKPEGFDPAGRYPMLVYFYETMSDGLHTFRTPIAGGSSISISFYVSRGYVVFVPDVHYRIGYPGESAFDCVVSGVLHILSQGFVDPSRVGVQGHSWGGYQIAYLLTRTNIFAAAEAGAPVANMTSAYGGIRWGSGMSRMFQYERSQSRIGGSLWDAQRLYFENSPLFRADRIETPLLMLHNDQDDAVPWYQGIELFVALRRLGKPAWLLNYNGEPHGLRKWQNRKDWAVRMQQFFDHYLKDAPPPVWLARGVPAVLKGKTLGLELLEQEGSPEVANSGNRH